MIKNSWREGFALRIARQADLLFADDELFAIARGGWALDTGAAAWAFSHDLAAFKDADDAHRDYASWCAAIGCRGLDPPRLCEEIIALAAAELLKLRGWGMECNFESLGVPNASSLSYAKSAFVAAAK